MNFKTLGILLLIFLAGSGVVRSQTWEVGFFGGAAGYMGDINPVRLYKVTDPAYGIFVKRNFDGYWGLRLNITHGRISGADSVSNNEQQRRRNLSFFTPITELGLQAEFNFFNYIPSLSRKKYSPYLFAGGGLTLFNPKARYMGQTYELNPLATENEDRNNPYRKYTVAVPYGAGIKYNVFLNFTLGAEVGYRTTFTDYLDDVSRRYPDFTQLDPSDRDYSLRVALSDRSVEKGYEPNAPYTQRGDFRARDTYFFTGITLTYTFLGRACPPVQ